MNRIALTNGGFDRETTRLEKLVSRRPPEQDATENSAFYVEVRLDWLRETLQRLANASN